MVGTCDAVPGKVAQGVVVKVVACQLDKVLNSGSPIWQQCYVILVHCVQIWLQPQQ